jgi:hypothetical protein
MVSKDGIDDEATGRIQFDYRLEIGMDGRDLTVLHEFHSGELKVTGLGDKKR